MRRQLPAYSPLDLRSWGRACLDSIRQPHEARRALASFLARRFSCERVILTGSGTQALELAIRLARRAERRDAPVALPAYSCFDVVTAAVGAGAPVLFYDLDPFTLTPDLEGLEAALSGGVGTVVASNLYGFPVDWDGVRSQCHAAGATLIEDAAQGLGSTWKGREGGTFGDLTVLSFGRGKGWTGGGGGALLIRSREGRLGEVVEEELFPARETRGGRPAATSLAQWALGRPSLYGLPSALPWLALGETTYRDPVPVRAIPAFSAALARATADASAAAVAGRRGKAKELQALLDSQGASASVRWVRPAEGGDAAYLRCPVLCTGLSRPRFDSGQARSLGIQPGYPLPLPELPAVQGLRRGGARTYPGARELCRSLFTLPTHALLRERDLAKICDVLTLPLRSGR